MNFVAAEMPTEIRFEHDSQTEVRDYLREKLMLQSRVQIKAFDVSESKWFDAPIMQTITGPATESHVVNRGTAVAFGQPQLNVPERKSHPRGKPLQPKEPRHRRAADH